MWLAPREFEAIVTISSDEHESISARVINLVVCGGPIEYVGLAGNFMSKLYEGMGCVERYAVIEKKLHGSEVI